MAIKQFGDEYGGVDELAKAIPAAIEGFYNAEEREMKKKELAARLMAENSKKERQQAMDRLKAENEYGLVVPEGEEFNYGLINKGLMAKKPGFVTMDEMKRQQIEADIRSKGEVPIREERELIAAQQAKGFDPIYDDTGKFTGKFQKSEALISKEQAELKKLEAQAKATEAKAKPKAGGAGDKSRYNVPGAIYEGTTTLKPDEVKAVRQIVTNVNPLVENIKKAQAKLQNASRKDYLDPNFRREVQGLLNDAKLTYKSDAFAQLGVLTGPDMAVLDAVIADPFTMAGTMSGPQEVAKSYDRAIEQIKTRINAKLAPYGYKPDPTIFESKTVQPPQAPAAGGGSPWEKFKK